MAWTNGESNPAESMPAPKEAVILAAAAVVMLLRILRQKVK